MAGIVIKTSKMKAKEIHNGQWIAENKVISPLNPHGDEPSERDCICSDCLQDNERDKEWWEEFEEFATQHTYATNLEDGVYQAEDLEITGQWKFVDKDKWYVLSSLKIPYEQWDIQMPKQLYETRKCITLNPTP